MNRYPGPIGVVQSIVVAIVFAVLLCVFVLRDRLEDFWEEF